MHIIEKGKILVRNQDATDAHFTFIVKWHIYGDRMGGIHWSNSIYSDTTSKVIKRENCWWINFWMAELTPKTEVKKRGRHGRFSRMLCQKPSLINQDNFIMTLVDRNTRLTPVLEIYMPKRRL